MFPNVNTQTEQLTATNSRSGTRSFLFDFNSGDFVVNDGKITQADGLSALKVWIEKILRTEKDRFLIYLDTEYGCRLEDLIIGGNYPISFIESELKREIEDALLTNPSITAISNFKLNRTASTLSVSMEVTTVDKGTNSISVTF